MKRAASPARLRALSACGLLALVGCGREVTDGVERPDNVLLFVVDTLRADRLGAYGHERDTSPALDALAARGTLYERNRSQAPWTVPSMISMMTGLYVTDEEQVLPPDRPTLAELLSDAEISTAAFIGNRVLTTDRGFERGFEHFEYVRATRANRVVESFIAWHEAHRESDGRPYFAWLHPLDPHTPYAPLAANDVFQGPRPGQPELERRWSRDFGRIAELDPEGETLDYAASVAYIEGQNNRYDGEVLAVDKALARLVKHLRASGDFHRTLIVFAADHGELLWEYPKYPQELQARMDAADGLPLGLADLYAYGHRAWYYPELWNTPLVFVGPGFPAGERREGLSGNLDLFPTLLAAFGLDFEDERPGVDLTGGVDPDRDRIYAHGFETSAVLERAGLQLVEYAPKRFALPDDAARPTELFDVAAGGELLDRAADLPDDRARLAAELADWRDRHRREITVEVPGDQALEALRDLGYLED